MNAVIEKPRAAKAPKASAPPKAKPQPAAADSPSAERSFMEGKALAALMIREAYTRQAGGDDCDINASYREVSVPQDNYTARFLELLMKEPRLLDGFTAALSSMLAECLDRSAEVPEVTAKLSYVACTQYFEPEVYQEFDSLTEPPLDEQLAKFALEDLVTVAPQAEPTAPEIAKPEPQKQEASTFHRLSVDAMARAETKVSQAVHLMAMIEDKRDSATVYGLTRLIETLPQEINQAMARNDIRDGLTNVLDGLSSSLLEVNAIIIAVNEGLDDLGLHAVASLLQLAKDIVDEANDQAALLRLEARRIA